MTSPNETLPLDPIALRTVMESMGIHPIETAPYWILNRDDLYELVVERYAQLMCRMEEGRGPTDG